MGNDNKTLEVKTSGVTLIPVGLEGKTEFGKKKAIDSYKDRRILVEDFHRGLIEGEVVEGKVGVIKEFSMTYYLETQYGNVEILHYHDVLGIFEVKRERQLTYYSGK